MWLGRGVVSSPLVNDGMSLCDNDVVVGAVGAASVDDGISSEVVYGRRMFCLSSNHHRCRDF